MSNPYLPSPRRCQLVERAVESLRVNLCRQGPSAGLHLGEDHAARPVCRPADTDDRVGVARYRPVLRLSRLQRRLSTLQVRLARLRLSSAPVTTTIRLRFDRKLTALRPFDDQRYDRAAALRRK